MPVPGTWLKPSGLKRTTLGIWVNSSREKGRGGKPILLIYNALTQLEPFTSVGLRLMLCVLSFQWENLQMTGSERRKIMCSVIFHVIAIVCVVWSLYVLIDRTVEEIKQGHATGMCSE